MFNAIRPLIIALSFVPGAVLAQAQSDKIDALYDALNLGELVEIMRVEGLEYGASIGADLIGERSTGAEWVGIVDRIYAQEAMETQVRADFGASLETADIDPMLEFFNSPLGQEIISLEISARRAFLDEEVEDAATEAAAIASMDETSRHQLLAQYADANDLIESNVVGALNSNYAFYLGMADGGAFNGELTETDMLSAVWEQEGEIRKSTTEWVFAFMTLAYQPLEDAELEAYIAFSQTEAGQNLNTALFAGFADMFDHISRALGRGAAHMMSGADL